MTLSILDNHVSAAVCAWDLIVKVTPMEAGFDFTSLIIYISQLNNNPKM